MNVIIKSGKRKGQIVEIFTVNSYTLLGLFNINRFICITPEQTFITISPKKCVIQDDSDNIVPSNTVIKGFNVDNM